MTGEYIRSGIHPGTPQNTWTSLQHPLELPGPPPVQGQVAHFDSLATGVRGSCHKLVCDTSAPKANAAEQHGTLKMAWTGVVVLDVVTVAMVLDL
jgi:hypothetical protein